MTEKLLDELAGDSPERLKWLVCREVGIAPGSLAWYAMTPRRVLRFACHLALDARERAAFTGGGGDERGAAEGFDLERFRELGGEL